MSSSFERSDVNSYQCETLNGSRTKEFRNTCGIFLLALILLSLLLRSSKSVVKLCMLLLLALSFIAQVFELYYDGVENKKVAFPDMTHCEEREDFISSLWQAVFHNRVNQPCDPYLIDVYVNSIWDVNLLQAFATTFVVPVVTCIKIIAEFVANTFVTLLPNATTYQMLLCFSVSISSVIFIYRLVAIRKTDKNNYDKSDLWENEF